ncbi:hypothetical protein MCOR01_011649 [Pyricularia oryzae]|nr:hypothetical protein MCOR01_011649 [Pyricularia oryzae]
MTLVAYLLGPTDGLGRNLQVFPYLGVPLIDLQPVQKYKAVVFNAQNSQWVPSGRRRGQLDRPRVLHSPGSPRRSLRLGQAYAAPVQLCTFDEFWRAPWPGRGMVALFQKHGLYGRISDMGTFEALMAIPYAHSVWFLTMP